MLYCERKRNESGSRTASRCTLPKYLTGDEIVNEPQIIQNCFPCFVWNLFVPALAWALVIAGLTWTIRIRTGDSSPDQHLDEALAQYPASGNERGAQQVSKLDLCCGIFACSQPSKRGEETCMQKK